ncbi:NACHT domain-containing protein [Streptomyces sp. NPDC002409]
MLIAAGVVFAVWNIIDGKKPKGVDVATLLGVPIGVTGLVIAVVALRRPVEDGGAELARKRAEKLAKQVEEGESDVWRQLLGADTQRINLAYVLHSAAERAATAPSAGRTFADGPAALPDVLDYYRATRPRRLVVTGTAGAGKTVLALELMLALIKDRSEGDPVPVRIPLAQWDTDQPLTTLLVQRLTDAYDWSADAAAGLVAHGMVLPVLDGLDEMDPLRADGTPDPGAPRARAALEALNAYQDGREAGPLVLTCRTGHYDALPPVSRLIDVARIAIAPVDTRNAVAYLRARALDRPRWQPLIDHLDAHPVNPLATALSTPWRLCLAATVYYRDGNPSELLHHTNGHDLDQHLLVRYLPAATANAENSHGYRPEDVHRWLHHLTHHLTGTGTGTGTSVPATDLTLHRLWPLAGTTRVRVTDLLLTIAPAALTGAFMGFFAGPFFFGIDGGIFDRPVFSPDLAFVSAMFGVFGAFVGSIAFRPTPRPNRFRINRGTLHGGFMARFWTGFKTWFAVGFAIGFTIGSTSELPSRSTGVVFGLGFGIGLGIGTGLIGGFMGGLSDGFADGFKTWFRVWFSGGLVVVLGLDSGFDAGLGLVEGPSLWLGIGLVGGLAGGVKRGLAGEPTGVANPRGILRDDVVHGFLIGPLAGLLAGLLGGLTGALVGGLSNGLADGSPSTGEPMLEIMSGGLVIGLAAGCTVGLAVGLASGFASAARRYTVFLLCSRGKLPFRLGVFLDWAVTAGLLRYNGPSYQFRHRELQQWLSQHPHP